MHRRDGHFGSVNKPNSDKLEIAFEPGSEIGDKTGLDRWLTERYALFQDSGDHINTFDIQHVEWSIFNLKIKDLNVDYPRFQHLLVGDPDLVHYSPGVQVLTWDRITNKKTK